jgi:hypothetical protein
MKLVAVAVFVGLVPLAFAGGAVNLAQVKTAVWAGRRK